MPPIHVVIESDWTAVIAPVAALLGVLVGIAGTAGREAWKEKRRAEKALRTASRMLILQLQWANTVLTYRLDGREAKYDPADAAEVQAIWTDHQESFGTLRFDEWREVANVVHGLSLFAEERATPTELHGAVIKAVERLKPYIRTRHEPPGASVPPIVELPPDG